MHEAYQEIYILADATFVKNNFTKICTLTVKLFTTVNVYRVWDWSAIKALNHRHSLFMTKRILAVSPFIKCLDGLIINDF